MKNKIGGIFIVFSMMVLGFCLWCQRPGLPMLKVFPSHPLVFVHLVHVQEHVDQAVQSDFGKNIAAIDVPDILSRNNFSPKDISDVERWQQDLMRFWDNPLIKKLLSKEAVAAIYREKGSYKIFIGVRLTLSTRIAEALGQLSHQWGNGVTVQHQKYQGRVINHISFKKQGFRLAYVRIRDLLIFAPGSLGHLEDVVDVYAHKKDSLLQDASFNLVRQNAYPSGDGLVFVNLNLFSDLWPDDMDSRLTSLGYQRQAFPMLGVSYMPGVVSKYKMIVGLDKKYMSLGMRKTFACPALSNDSLKLVPANAILYNWGICYDLDQTWANVKEHLNESPQLAQTIKNLKRKIESHFRINIRSDVLPVLGHEIGGYLTDVDMQGNYPFPRFLIFIKIQDRPAAEHLLDKLVQHPVTAMQSEKYNNVDIHYFSLSLGSNMEPGYGFLGDYLLVASSRQLLKKSIDAYNNSLRSIVSDDTLGQLGLVNGEKFHSVTLMKTSELVRRAQDFLGWADKYLSGQVSMAAAYKQDGNNKQLELDQAIADKTEELSLAKKKMAQLQNAPLSLEPPDNQDSVSGAIENLTREEESLRSDIGNYILQKEDLSRLLDNYASEAQSAKLVMYNMESILFPVLKGLESIDTQAVTVRFGDKVLETEFLVK